MISIIIPVLNEEAILDRTLENISRQEGLGEVIVVDGGSDDRTAAVAAGHARVIRAARGRARQMNAGARVARGKILLFLHADCMLEAGSILEAERALDAGRAVGGCFTQRILRDGILYRIIERCADFRARALPYFYGDSGIFIHRDLFFRLGGFSEIPIMEEIGLTRAMKHAGPVRVLRKRIFISPRRYGRDGVIRTTLRNWAITARFHLGVPPETLAREYRAIR